MSAKRVIPSAARDFFRPGTLFAVSSLRVEKEVRNMKLFRAVFLGLAVAVVSTALGAESLDEAVTHVKVRAVLLEHFGTDALGIAIQVNGGSVVLSGTVEKSNTQELAKQAALSVKGVASVENRIQVGSGPATKAKTSANRAKAKLKDALLEAKVKGRLFDQVGGNALKIEVEASGGLVTLKGAVPSKNIRETAVETAKKTGGVRRVVSLITVG
jgi:osmotically-inducible protein OsmY